VVKDPSGFKKNEPARKHRTPPYPQEMDRYLYIFFYISSLHVFIIYTNPGQQLKIKKQKNKKTQFDVLFFIFWLNLIFPSHCCKCVGIEMQRSIRFNQQVFQECTVGYIS
jgi:hypothetical protein